MAKPKRTTKQTNVGNRTIAQLTKALDASLIRERKIRLSPLGKMAFDGGNAVSNFFGAGKIFGSGAYKMTGGNSTWNTTNQVPIMHSSGDSIVFSHREYIGQIDSSLGFEVQKTINVNPGLAASFPYLSGIANSFQEHRFKGLVYEFKSTSADALDSTNTALGSVMMVAQYRADAPAPTNKLQVLNEMWSADSKPSLNCFLPIECAPKESPLNVQYIRTDSTTSVQDRKFYDLANVYVCTQGMQEASDIGELWVTYEVELMKPVMETSGGPFSSNSSTLAGSLVSTTFPAGTAFPGLYYGLQVVYDTTASTFTATLPGDRNGSRFLFVHYISATTTYTYTTTTFTNGTLIAAWEQTAAGPQSTVAAVNTGATHASRMWVVEVDSDDPLVFTLAATVAGTGGTSDLKIIQVSDSWV